MKKLLIFLFVITIVFTDYHCKDHNSDVVGGVILSDMIRPVDRCSMRSSSNIYKEDFLIDFGLK